MSLRGDVFQADIPGGIGEHSAVVLHERGDLVVVIFGQSDNHTGAHLVSPGDSVAAEFGGKIRWKTYFHKNNLAVMPVSRLPAARLGHIEDHDLPAFAKAAQPGLIELGRIEQALVASGHCCQCQGGCKKHQPPCGTPRWDPRNYALMDWRVTTKKTVVCRACWDW